jgi:hypothetical protein
MSLSCIIFYEVSYHRTSVFIIMDRQSYLFYFNNALLWTIFWKVIRTIEPSDYWAFGLLGLRTIGPSDYWADIMKSGKFYLPTDSTLLMTHCNNIVLLRDVFHIGLVIGPRPAVLAWGADERQYSKPRTYN